MGDVMKNVNLILVDPNRALCNLDWSLAQHRQLEVRYGGDQSFMLSADPSA
jgi:hypothetical protein